MSRNVMPPLTSSTPCVDVGTIMATGSDRFCSTAPPASRNRQGVMSCRSLRAEHAHTASAHLHLALGARGDAFANNLERQVSRAWRTRSAAQRDRPRTAMGDDVVEHCLELHERGHRLLVHGQQNVSSVQSTERGTI